MKRGKIKQGLVIIWGIVAIFFLLLASPKASKRTSNTGPYSPNTSDSYDPNEYYYSASYISDGLTNNLQVSSTDYDDYYQVYMNSNYRIVVNINWTGSSDLDLYLYDDDYDQVNSSTGTYNLYENTSYTVSSSGTYYIRVKWYDGIGTTTYSLRLSTTTYVNAFSPMLFLSIFIPIVVIVSILIIVAVVVHQHNKNQKVIHPATVRPAQPWQPATSYTPQPTPSYAPQPTPSYAPQHSPYASVAPSKPESKGRFCNACGAKLELGQKFCQNCGIEIQP